MPLSDEQLMRDYLSGDAEAFAEIYRRHSGRVYAYLKARTGSQQEADDLFQAVFLKFHQSRHQYSAKFPLLHWIFVIARTTWIDRLRAQKTAEAPSSELLESLQNESPDPTPEEALSQGNTDFLLRNIPDDQKNAIQLRVIDELSYSEIAAKLKKSEATVRQLVSRGLRALRSGYQSG